MENYKEFNWKTEHFLIADDDPYCHILLEKILLKLGGIVSHAYNGAEAIESLLANSDISVAIIDLLMPVTSGIDVVKKVKEVRSDVLYVAFSADIFQADKKLCECAGFDLCFLKPIQPEKMFTSIKCKLLAKDPLNLRFP